MNLKISKGRNKEQTSFSLYNKQKKKKYFTKKEKSFKIKIEKNVRIKRAKEKKAKGEGKMQKIVRRESLGAVHTHTHTHTHK